MTSALISLSFSIDSKYLAAGGIGGQLHRYDLTQADVSTCKADHSIFLPSAPKMVQLHPRDPNLCLVACASRPVFFLNFTEETILQKKEKEQNKTKISNIQMGEMTEKDKDAANSSTSDTMLDAKEIPIKNTEQTEIIDTSLSSPPPHPYSLWRSSHTLLLPPLYTPHPSTVLSPGPFSFNNQEVNSANHTSNTNNTLKKFVYDASMPPRCGSSEELTYFDSLVGEMVSDLGQSSLSSLKGISFIPKIPAFRVVSSPIVRRAMTLSETSSTDVESSQLSASFASSTLTTTSTATMPLTTTGSTTPTPTSTEGEVTTSASGNDISGVNAVLDSVSTSLDFSLSSLRRKGMERMKDRLVPEYITAAVFDVSGSLLILGSSKGAISVVDALTYEPLVMLAPLPDSQSFHPEVEEKKEEGEKAEEGKKEEKSVNEEILRGTQTAPMAMAMANSNSHVSSTSTILPIPSSSLKNQDTNQDTNQDVVSRARYLRSIAPLLPLRPSLPSASVKSLVLSRDGHHVSALFQDRVIRVYALHPTLLSLTRAHTKDVDEAVSATNNISASSLRAFELETFISTSKTLSPVVSLNYPERLSILAELQILHVGGGHLDCADLIARTHWRSIAMSPSGRFIYGLVLDSSDHIVFVWLNKATSSTTTSASRFSSAYAAAIHMKTTGEVRETISRNLNPQWMRALQSWRVVDTHVHLLTNNINNLPQDSFDSCTTFCTNGNNTFGLVRGISEPALLVCRLQGPREGSYDLASSIGTRSSPAPSALASVTASGRVLLWTHHPKDRWSAFAPDFAELTDNVDYIEREDEFDLIETTISSGFDRKRDIMPPKPREHLCINEKNKIHGQDDMDDTQDIQDKEEKKNAETLSLLDGRFGITVSSSAAAKHRAPGVDIMSPYLPRDQMAFIDTASKYVLTPEIDPFVTLLFSKACEALDLQSTPIHSTFPKVLGPSMRPNSADDFIIAPSRASPQSQTSIRRNTSIPLSTSHPPSEEPVDTISVEGQEPLAKKQRL